MGIEKFYTIFEKAKELNDMYNKIRDGDKIFEYKYEKTYKYGLPTSPKIHAKDIPFEEITTITEIINDNALQEFLEFFNILPPKVIISKYRFMDYSLTVGGSIYYNIKGEENTVEITVLAIRNLEKLVSEYKKSEYNIYPYKRVSDLLNIIPKLIITLLVYEIAKLDEEDILLYAILTSNILGAYTKKRILLEAGVSRMKAEEFEREVRLFNNEYRKIHNFLPSANSVVANIILKNIDLREILPPLVAGGRFYMVNKELEEAKRVVSEFKKFVLSAPPYMNYIDVVQSDIKSIVSDIGISAISEVITRIGEDETISESRISVGGGGYMGVIPVVAGIPEVAEDGNIYYEVVFKDGSSLKVSEENLYRVLKNSDVIHVAPIKVL